MISLMHRPQGLTYAISAVWLYLAVVPASAGPLPGATPRGGADAAAAIQSSVPGAHSPDTRGEMESGVTSDASPFHQLSAIRARLPTVTAPPDSGHIQQRRQEKGANPRKIGFGVDIPELNQKRTAKSSFLQVRASDGGTLLGLRIYSPGAAAIRLGLLIEHIPAEVSVVFVAADAHAAPAVTAEEITGLIDLNRAAGDDSDEGRTYWSPVVEGEEAVILFHLPKGIDPSELRFSIPRISHILEDPLSSKAAGFCNNDLSCYSRWSGEASAVAKMVYTKGGSSFSCTGSLLNDSDPSGFIPYLLSANHCISTQTVASTLETLWYYQSASCDSFFQDSRFTTRSGGAQLLYASAATDTAFMRLNQQPPAGVYYLGWTASDPVIGADVTGIHHPDGDWKKISFGDVLDYQDCWSTGDGDFSCKPASSVTGEYLEVGWVSGVTESGSSGSALLNTSDQVIGNLWGGNDSCYDLYGTATYGRFALAYEAGLKAWLNCGPSESRFCDVLPDYWAWPHIQTIADAGITSGCGPTWYCPEDPVTRAQMAVFLLRGIYGGGYTAPAATGGVFNDVPRTYWAAPWIELFAAEGITSGCGAGNYCPDSNVTRAQMAVFLLRSKHGSTYKPPAATGNLFNDVPWTFWASSWIEQLAAEGITGGCSGGNYCPHESATRAQMAVFTQKTFNLPLPQRPERLSTR